MSKVKFLIMPRLQQVIDGTLESATEWTLAPIACIKYLEQVGFPNYRIVLPKNEFGMCKDIHLDYVYKNKRYRIVTDNQNQFRAYFRFYCLDYVRPPLVIKPVEVPGDDDDLGMGEYPYVEGGF